MDVPEARWRSGGLTAHLWCMQLPHTSIIMHALKDFRCGQRVRVLMFSPMVFSKYILRLGHKTCLVSNRTLAQTRDGPTLDGTTLDEEGLPMCRFRERVPDAFRTLILQCRDEDRRDGQLLVDEPSHVTDQRGRFRRLGDFVTIP